MKIKLGNNNKIKNSSIGHNINTEDNKKKRFSERHPILTAVGSSSFVSFIFLFPFWEDIVKWIENLSIF